MSANPIYISKTGDDNSFGNFQDIPVKTIERATQIANAIVFSNPNAVIKFCFVAGNWGDASFTGFKPYLQIAPYSGAAATAYSDDLPKFGNLTFYNCGVHLISVVADCVGAAESSFCYIWSRYKSIGKLQAWRNLQIMVGYSDADANVWEIKGGNEADNVIEAIEGTNDSIWRCHIKLSKEVTGSFIYLRENCEFTVDARTDFVATAYGVSGAKVNAWRNSFITTFECPGVYAWLNKIPGTGGVNIVDGVFVNGISTAAASKAWVNQKLGLRRFIDRVSRS